MNMAAFDFIPAYTPPTSSPQKPTLPSDRDSSTGFQDLLQQKAQSSDGLSQAPTHGSSKEQSDTPDVLLQELAALFVAGSTPTVVPDLSVATQGNLMPTVLTQVSDSVITPQKAPPTAQTLTSTVPVLQASVLEEPVPTQVQLQTNQPSKITTVEPVLAKNTSETSLPVAEEAQSQTEFDLSGETPDAKPLFRSVDHIPVKVGDSPVDTTAPDFEQTLSKQITEGLNKGDQKISIRLSPENLGTVIVEMTHSENGTLQVMLRASSNAATSLLQDRSAELSGLLRQNTQAPVFVEVQQADQSQQHQQQQQQRQGNPHHNGQQQQQQHPNHQQNQDFLDQLRLGLISPDDEVV